MSNYRYSTGEKRPRWGGKKVRGRTSQGWKSQGANKPEANRQRRKSHTPWVNWSSTRSHSLIV